MVVPCTSNRNQFLTIRQYLITGNEISIAGIRVESVVHCESILTLNKSMIIRKLGFLVTAAKYFGIITKKADDETRTHDI